MKKTLSLLLAGLAFAFMTSTGAAGEYAIGAKPSMAVKGQFHKVHVKKVKTACDDCHTKGELPDNTLRLRLHDRLAKGDPGPVDAETCFDCHRRAGKPLPYYAKKEQ